MRALLDSHALFWAISDDPNLSIAARKFVSAADNEISVSTASFYELIFKAVRGRMPAAALKLPEAAADAGFREVDVSKAHLLAAARMDWTHGDPWDRIIAAQAIDGGYSLLSADAVFDEIDVKRIW